MLNRKIVCKLIRVKNVVTNKNIFITIRIVAILVLRYHYTQYIEYAMCRPRPYVTCAFHFRWLSFLL